MRVVFMGTGDIAIPSFKALVESDFELVALITQPDKPVGRKQVLTPPAIKTVAQEQNIAVLQPESVRTEDALAEINSLQADVIIVMAYGQILTQPLIDMPTKAIINLHASLLPKHRGASCIQAAIEQGDELTGVTVMHVVKALDAGDIIYKVDTPIGEMETGGELHDRLAEMSPAALLEALSQIESGTDTREPQDDDASNYAPKLLRKHGEIDWSQSAEEIERLIRAYQPWPGTYTTFKDNKGREKRLKIFAPVKVVEDSGTPGSVLKADDELIVACGQGSLALQLIQPEGSKQMEASAFLLSASLQVGDVLGE